MKTYIGTAQNAKGGAVLITSVQVLYLENKSEWEEEFLGKEVSVTGKLEERKIFPDPVNEKGEIVQGAWGTQWVLVEYRISKS